MPHQHILISRALRQQRTSDFHFWKKWFTVHKSVGQDKHDISAPLHSISDLIKSFCTDCRCVSFIHIHSCFILRRVKMIKLLNLIAWDIYVFEQWLAFSMRYMYISGKSKLILMLQSEHLAGTKDFQGFLKNLAAISISDRELSWNNAWEDNSALHMFSLE